MATYTLYVCKYTGMSRIARGLSYSYDGQGTLKIFAHGKLRLIKHNVELGEMYTVYDTPVACSVDILKRSEHQDGLLMWMTSFNRKHRAFTRGEYERTLAMRRAEYTNERGLKEYTVRGEGYAFTVFGLSSGKDVRAAAYVAQDLQITKDLVTKVLKELHGGIRFPRQYIYNKVLRQSFGFINKDFQELEAWEKAEGKNIFRAGFWS